MCYNKSYLTKRQEAYAKRYGRTAEESASLLTQLLELGGVPTFHVSGFDHPSVPVITGETDNIQFYSWGLIPNWVKTPVEAVEMSNTLINARAETMFEKSAFRDAARERRCLVLVDGFFEHHHKFGKKFPYHIRFANGEPMTMAGLWDEWVDKQSGVIRRTYTVVTTRANTLLQRIHNNPKASEGPRMPLILTKETERDWLRPIHEKADQEFIESIVQPLEATWLESFTVKRLLGKEAVGNLPEALQPHRYVELEEQQGSLF